MPFYFHYLFHDKYNSFNIQSLITNLLIKNVHNLSHFLVTIRQ